MRAIRVLWIDDYEEMLSSGSRLVKMVLGEETEILTARTLKEAELQYEENGKSLDIILMDTSLAKGVFTFDFTKKISGEFKGDIVATTTNDQYAEEMMRLGCTHRCIKYEISEFLAEWKKEKNISAI